MRGETDTHPESERDTKRHRDTQRHGGGGWTACLPTSGSPLGAPRPGCASAWTILTAPVTQVCLL